MRKQPERTAKTKKALTDAFWNLYEEKPIEKITVREITEKAGLYRSTFYEYFTDVYAVRESIEQEIIDSSPLIASQVPQISSIADGMKLLMEFYSKNAKYLAVLLGPHGDSEFLNDVKKLIKPALHKFFNIDTDDLETDIFIEMAISGVISILNYWYSHRDKLSIEEVIATGSQFMQHGLIPFFIKKGFVLKDFGGQ